MPQKGLDKYYYYYTYSWKNPNNHFMGNEEAGDGGESFEDFLGRIDTLNVTVDEQSRFEEILRGFIEKYPYEGGASEGVKQARFQDDEFSYYLRQDANGYTTVSTCRHPLMMGEGDICSSCGKSGEDMSIVRHGKEGSTIVKGWVKWASLSPKQGGARKSENFDHIFARLLTGPDSFEPDGAPQRYSQF